MSYEILSLRDGQHYEITPEAQDFQVELTRVGKDQRLRLVASIGGPLTRPISRWEANQAATTLAIHMGPKAAMALCERIRELIQTTD
jgi:hypothetical protein